MKKLIIKSNEWYDDLPDLKRFLFFLVVIMGSLLAVQILGIIYNFIWAFPIWCLIFVGWRMSYSIFKLMEERRK